MELKLESKDAKSLGKDFYLSVRVAEVQKISKFGDSRTFKFSQHAVGQRNYGRVELFRRVGHAVVCIDPSMDQSAHEVCIDFEGDSLTLKATVTKPDDPKGRETKPQKDKVEESPKLASAKQYLEKHHLEARLAEAMQSVLKERPDDPCQFMAQQLGNNAAVTAHLPRRHFDSEHIAVPETEAPVECTGRGGTDMQYERGLHMEPAVESTCRSCGNTGKDFLGNTCTCKFGAEAAPPFDQLPCEPAEATCRNCGNTGVDFLGGTCSCKHGRDGIPSRELDSCEPMEALSSRCFPACESVEVVSRGFDANPCFSEEASPQEALSSHGFPACESAEVVSRGLDAMPSCSEEAPPQERAGKMLLPMSCRLGPTFCTYGLRHNVFLL
eukprot:TRINITY_DN61702_c0_g1_i1.p1 TRINITY_DN61702_c0_g1~~TRINITY_DN61702_c0_g1_i1.p1  ORF type:complete len:383 (-),score=75.55 TRINITY_DN61702_c0_g1_i1:37-1185(-)